MLYYIVGCIMFTLYYTYITILHLRYVAIIDYKVTHCSLFLQIEFLSDIYKIKRLDIMVLETS